MMKLRHVGSCLVLLFSAIALLGCSPNGGSSKVSMELPDWGAMHTADIARRSQVSSLAFEDARVVLVSVNVTGGGMSPVYFGWERNSEQSVAPREVSLLVPRGSNRLFQVLAVYKSDSGLIFYYGDATATLEADQVPLGISLVNAGASVNAMEGTIVGRFMDKSTEGGPTGVFQYRFTPVGKPSMVVMHNEIFAGWTSILAFNTPLLQYTKPDGTPLFDIRNPIDNSLVQLTTESKVLFQSAQMQRAVSVRVPAGYVQKDGATVPSPAKRVVAGFFGPGAAAQKLCVDGSSGGEIFDLKRDSAGSAMLWYGGISTPPAGHAYREAVLAIDGSAAAYGGDSTATCADTGTAYVDYLKFNHQKLEHGDDVLGFFGPFISDGGNTLGLNYNSSTQTVTVQWKILPGADAVLPGYVLYYRPKATDPWDDSEVRSMNGFRCNDFKNSALFSVPFQSVEVGKGATSAQIPNMTEAVASTLQFIVCARNPNVPGGFFMSAAVGSAGNQNGGGSGGDAIATKLVAISHLNQLTSSTSKAGLVANTCYPVRIEGRSATDGNGRVDGSRTIQVTASEIADYLYTDSTCMTTGASNTLTLTNFWGRSYVYLKSPRSMGAANLSVTVVSGGTLDPATFHYENSVGTYANSLKTFVTTHDSTNVTELYAWRCADVSFQLVDAAGRAAADANSGAFNFAAVADLQFFDSSDFSCSGAAKTGIFEFSGYETVKHFKVRYKGTLNGTSINVAPVIDGSWMSGGVPLSVEAKPVTVQQPGAPYQLRVYADNTTAEGCGYVRVDLVDSNGRAVSPTSSVSFTYSVSGPAGAAFKTGCAGTAQSTGYIDPGEIEFSGLSFVPLTSGSYTITITPTSGGLQGSQRTITVGAAVASKVNVGLPGQSWNEISKSFTGIPLHQTENVPFSIQLRAMTSGGSLDPMFNLATNDFRLKDGNGGFVLTLLSPPAWVNGLGTATVKFTQPKSVATIMTGGDSSMLESQTTQPFEVFPQPNQLLAQAVSAGISNGTCQPLLVTLASSYGTVVRAPQNFSFPIGAHAGAPYVYNSDSCDSTNLVSGGSLIFNQGESSKVIYFKGTGISYAFGFGGFGSIAGSSYSTSGGTTAEAYPSQVRFTTSHSSIQVGACQAFLVGTYDTYGNSVPPMGQMTVRVSKLSGPAGGQFYLDPNCQSGGSTLIDLNIDPNVVGHKRARVVYFKTSEVGAFTLDASDITGSTYCGSGGMSSCSSNSLGVSGTTMF